MPQVFRAYIPTVKTTLAQTLGVATAAMPSSIMRVTVDPRLVHRKVWCFLDSTAAAYAMNFDLVAFLNGSEVYRQKICDWAVPQVIGNWISGWYRVTNLVGALNEVVFASIQPAGQLIGAAPWRLNITADAFEVQIQSITGAAAVWDGLLMVHSQQGI